MNGDVVDALRARGYRTDGRLLPVARPQRLAFGVVSPDGLSLVAKTYPEGRGELAYANMVEVWRSSFGERRRPPGLPRPVAYLPDLGVLLMERVAGLPLSTLDPVPAAGVEEAVRLVADLHASDARPTTRRDRHALDRSFARKAADVPPPFREEFAAAAAVLRAAAVDEPELVPAHGDFSARNVLVGETRVLIDWDRFQLADSARDVAYIGAWSWFRALAERREPSWDDLDRALEAYERARPGTRVRERIDFHVAAALLRISHSRARWDDAAAIVPRLLAEARRRAT